MAMCAVIRLKSSGLSWLACPGVEKKLRGFRCVSFAWGFEVGLLALLRTEKGARQMAKNQKKQYWARSRSALYLYLRVGLRAWDFPIERVPHTPGNLLVVLDL
jgi:hypothetical protein